tara:strand:+ start:31 stop:807 length:777 start_codon:yes stop_codon:yes gene_type:complete
MSTILKTLKKLEEEKSILEKKLDLKELVLQDKDSVDIDSRISQKFLWKTCLLLVGSVLGLVWFGKDNPPEKTVSQLNQPHSVSLQRTTPVKKPTISSVSGIPLSNISEKARLQISHDRSTENQSPKLVNDNTEIERKKVESENRIAPGIRSKHFYEKDVFEIQSLIASAKSLANEPEKIQTHKIRSHISIPSLKVKGIIFFSPDNSSNHILVSNTQSSNNKMRIGDTIDSATLMKIESTGAVFAYQGESVFMGIGQSD